MQVFDKQPGDTLDYDADFTNWLPEGDTITSATAVCDITGTDALEIIAVSWESPIVKVWAEKGVDKVNYKVTVTASTQGGRIKETDFRIRVREK
jgi:hypothetical protein